MHIAKIPKNSEKYADILNQPFNYKIVNVCI